MINSLMRRDVFVDEALMNTWMALMNALRRCDEGIEEA